MKTFYQNLLRLLSQGENVVLATIFHTSGSAPRSAGAKMLVLADGSIAGTVGGGRLEAHTIELAKEVHTSCQSLIQQFDLTGSDAAGLGMICGGEGEILVDYIDASCTDNHKIYEALLSVMDKGWKAWLITELVYTSGCPDRQQCLVLPDGTIIGNFNGDAGFLDKLTTGPAKISIHADARENCRFIVEPIRNAGTVYLFGAGHVSQQIARLTDMVGFKTIALDDRAAFANKDRFPNADVVVIDSFDNLPALPIDQDSYAVIVTRGHLHDSIVLEQLLANEAAYIGMIGSRKKRDQTFKKLQEKGVSAEVLQRVFSPIGIDILAETPEEIAISITGELIRVRAEREKWLAAGK